MIRQNLPNNAQSLEDFAKQLDKSVPRIVVIGNMGNGKSRLLNSLSINGEFLIGDTNQAVTQEITPKLVQSRYSNQKLCLIDTEGFADKDGNDSVKSKKLGEFLKKIGHVNLFLFVIKSQDYRQNFICQQMIETFKKMFDSGDFMQNTAFVYTHHSFAQQEIDNRDDEKQTENYFKDKIFETLQSNNIKILRRDLKIFFIDNSMQRYLDKNLKKNPDILRQIKEFETTVKAIEEHTSKLSIFRCENVQEAYSRLEKERNDKLWAQKMNYLLAFALAAVIGYKYRDQIKQLGGNALKFIKEKGEIIVQEAKDSQVLAQAGEIAQQTQAQFLQAFERNQILGGGALFAVGGGAILTQNNDQIEYVQQQIRRQ